MNKTYALASVWAWFNSCGINSIHVIDRENPTAEFQSILNENFLPSVISQSGFRIHKSKFAKKSHLIPVFSDCEGETAIQFNNWAIGRPFQVRKIPFVSFMGSEDLNPFTKIWEDMGKKLKWTNKRPCDSEDFKEMVILEWERFRPSYWMEQAATMRSRLSI